MAHTRRMWYGGVGRTTVLVDNTMELFFQSLMLIRSDEMDHDSQAMYGSRAETGKMQFSDEWIWAGS